MIPELMSQVVIGDRPGFLCAGIIFQDLFCPQSSLGRDFFDAEVVEDCTPTNPPPQPPGSLRVVEDCPPVTRLLDWRL